MLSNVTFRFEDIHVAGRAQLIVTQILVPVLGAPWFDTFRFAPLNSIYLTQTLRDSIVRYDSVYVRDKGDTLYVERWKYLYRDKVRVDTMVSVRVDTLAVPYPVEKRLTRWEQIRLDVGGYAIFAVVIMVLIVVGYMVYKLKKGG